MSSNINHCDTPGLNLLVCMNNSWYALASVWQHSFNRQLQQCREKKPSSCKSCKHAYGLGGVDVKPAQGTGSLAGRVRCIASFSGKTSLTN